jgi:hypothetical protein
MEGQENAWGREKASSFQGEVEVGPRGAASRADRPSAASGPAAPDGPIVAHGR